MGDAGGRVVVDLRRVRPAQRRDDAREDHRQGVAAGVDDAGVAQDGQQVGGAADGLLALLDGALEDLGDGGVLACRCGASGSRRGSGMWASSVAMRLAISRTTVRIVPSAGSRTRRVGAVDGAGHGGADERRVDQLAGARHELLRRPADELGEDDAAVAAGAEQGGAGDGVDDLLAADLVDRAALLLGDEAVELVEDGAQRERHVVPRVAVGDREDVEVVDLLAAGFEMRERRGDDGAETREVREGRHGQTPAQTAFVTLPALRQRVQT